MEVPRQTQSKSEARARLTEGAVSMRLLRWSVNYDEDWEVCHRCPEKGRMRAICRQQHWERDHFPHLPRQPQQHADHSEVNTFDPSEQLPKCLWCFQPCTWETGQRISCRFCEQGPFHAVCWMRHYNTTHNHFHQPDADHGGAAAAVPHAVTASTGSTTAVSASTAGTAAARFASRNEGFAATGSGSGAARTG